MTAGDEALVCLETFWRNARWSLLFPHVPSDFDPSKNRDAHRDAVFRQFWRLTGAWRYGITLPC
jgi:hypothetical protein